MPPELFCLAWQACHSLPFEMWHAYNNRDASAAGSQAVLRPLGSPLGGQLSQEGIGWGATPPRGETSITCFGASVANLIQVNVGTPRCAGMAPAEGARDVIFGGSIEKGAVAQKRRERPT